MLFIRAHFANSHFEAAVASLALPGASAAEKVDDVDGDGSEAAVVRRVAVKSDQRMENTLISDHADQPTPKTALNVDVCRTSICSVTARQ